MSLADGGWKTFTDLSKRMEYIHFTAESHIAQIHEIARVNQRGRSSSSNLVVETVVPYWAIGPWWTFWETLDLILIQLMQQLNLRYLQKDNKWWTKAQVQDQWKRTLSTRSRTGNTIQFHKICFVCNEIRTCDSNLYNERGLAVSEFGSTADRLMKFPHQIDEGSELFDSKPSGDSKDIYSVEICYHRSYYSRFSYPKKQRDEF